MKKRLKKFVSLLLSLVLIFSAASTGNGILFSVVSHATENSGAAFVTGITAVCCDGADLYSVGDSLDRNGVIVTASYSDGTTRVITEGYTSIPAVFSRAGKQRVTISYEGFSANIKITISEKPERIEIENLPEKLTYQVGESIDCSGMSLLVYFSGGVTKRITTGFDVECNLDSAGKKTATVTYTSGGMAFSDSFDVEVKERCEIYSEKVTANAGATVSVPVKIRNNPGVAGFTLVMKYNKNIFTPQAVTLASEIPGTILDSIGSSAEGTFRVLWNDTKNYSDNGTLFYVTFSVDANAETNEESITLSYVQKDTFNEDYCDINFSCEDISVLVEGTESTPHLEAKSVSAKVDETAELNVAVSDIGSGLSFDYSYNSEEIVPVSIRSDSALLDISTSEISSGRVRVQINAGDKAEEKATIYISFCRNSDFIGESVVDIFYSDELVSSASVAFSDNYESVPTVGTDLKRVRSGSEFVMPVFIRNNTGLMGFAFEISYDCERLTLQSVERGEIINKGNFAVSDTSKNGYAKVVWNGAENVSQNGTVMLLNFIAGDVDENTIADIAITYNSRDIYDENWQDVALDVENTDVAILRDLYRISFVADNILIDTVYCTPSDGVEEPEVPAKAGMFGRWQEYEIDSDKTVYAVYDYPAVYVQAQKTLIEDEIFIPSKICNFHIQSEIWYSDNEDIAMVDSYGYITAVSEGECFVSVIVAGEDAFGNKVTARDSVKIIVRSAEPEDISLNELINIQVRRFVKRSLFDLVEIIKKIIVIITRQLGLVVYKEDEDVLHLLDDFSCTITVAADNEISDNNPVLPSEIQGYNITWTLSNSENYQIVDNRIAVKDYNRIEDEDLIVTASINVNQNVVTRSFTVSVKILRATLDYLSIESSGYSKALPRGAKFTYRVDLKSAPTEGFSNPVRPVEDNITYAYSAKSIDGETIDYSKIASVDAEKNFSINSNAPLNSVLTIAVIITHKNKKGVNIEDFSVAAKSVSVESTVYTATLNLNGGILVDSYNSEVNSITKEEDKLLFEGLSLSRPGYSFGGWYEDSSFSKLYSPDCASAKMPSRNITLYAKWTALSYGINLDACGGTVSPSSISALSDIKLGTLPVPEREHFTFDGWYTASSGGTEVTADSTFAGTSDRTVYAHWTCVPYTVSWSDGTGYTIAVSRTSSPNADAVIGNLSSGAKIYYGDVLEVTYTPLEVYTISSKGVESITVSGNVTSSRIYATATVKSYTVSWSGGTEYSIAVSRTSSPNADAVIGSLTSGAKIYYGDVLEVTYTPSEGYSISSKGVESITVSGNVTSSQIYATATVKSYTVSWSDGTGYTIAVSRTSSPNADAVIGSLTSGAKIYYGDVLEVTYTPSEGYSISSKGVESITVTDNVTSDEIYATATENQYTYDIIYKSSNGTSLGSTTVTELFGTTKELTAPTKTGYTTPASQSVAWDSTSKKTITFIYEPMSVSDTVAVVEFIIPGGKPTGNQTMTIHQLSRTSTTVKHKITVRYNIYSGKYDEYCYKFMAESGSIKTGWVTFSDDLYSAKCDYKEGSVEITVPVSATDNTVPLKITIYRPYDEYKEVALNTDSSDSSNTSDTVIKPVYVATY